MKKPQSLQKILGHVAFSMRLPAPLPLLNVCFIQRFVQCFPTPKAKKNTLFIANNIEMRGRSHETGITFILAHFRVGSAIFRGVSANLCQDCRSVGIIVVPSLPPKICDEFRSIPINSDQ